MAPVHLAAWQGLEKSDTSLNSNGSTENLLTNVAQNSTRKKKDYKKTSYLAAKCICLV